MKFTDMLNSGPVIKKSRRGEHLRAWARNVDRAHEVVRQRADERYFGLLNGREMASPEIAMALGLTCMGCLTSLYRLEKRGKIKRAGIRPRPAGSSYGKPAILWTWVEGAVPGVAPANSERSQQAVGKTEATPVFYKGE